MKIVVLIENTSPTEELASEHGLSLWIRLAGRDLLLDTGSTGAFAENAEKLGVDLHHVRLAFLSHGHYDHSGGFDVFCEKNEDAKIYIRAEACECCCEANEEGEVRYIGMPEGLIGRHPARFELVHEDVQVEPGIWIIGDDPAEAEDRPNQSGMVIKKADGTCEKDTFKHEQSLVLETATGLVIFNSCCHSGAAAIVRTVKKKFPDRPIVALIGGLHLIGPGKPHASMRMGIGEDAIRALGRELKELGVQRIYTGHCTGLPALMLLQDELGDMVRPLTTGMEIRL